MVSLLARFLPKNPLSMRGRRKIATGEALAEFLAAEAAFAIQKTAYGYCRARVGKQQDKLVAEDGFITRMEPCRWQSVAAMLGDMVLWTGRKITDDPARLMALYRRGLTALGPPAELSGWADWSVAEEAFAARLDRLPDVSPAGGPSSLQEAFDHSWQTLVQTLPFNRELVEWDQDQIRHTFRLWVVHHAEQADRSLDLAALRASGWDRDQAA